MVCVLLSTYNGERYLDEQIKSLTMQEGVLYKILVRDDGSTDSTTDILDKWQKQGVLTWYQGKNLGFAKSFMDLVIHAPKADYYAFCDQDDIWFPNKLKNALEKIELLHSEMKLYCSNLYIYRNKVNEGLWWKNKPCIDLYRSMVQNVATGCTMVFNASLRDVVINHLPHSLKYHDYWVYHTALLFGEVFFDEEAFIYYRQHDSNQVGAKSRLGDRLYSKVQSLKRLKTQHYREQEAKQLLLSYADMIPAKYVQPLKIMADYRESITYRLTLLFSHKYVMTNWLDTFWLKVRVILGCV